MKCKWCSDKLDENIDLCPRCWYKEWYWYWREPKISKIDDNHSNEEPLYSIKWNGWRLFLYKKYILIQRKWLSAFLSHWLKWDKQINIKSITAVQLKKPWFTTWYIQFSLWGWRESIWGVFNATKDENTVCFTWSENYNISLQIQSYINNYTWEKFQESTSIVDEIKKLWELLKEWLITQEEFDSHKKKLLN
jgi:hypothetical protein